MKVLLVVDIQNDFLPGGALAIPGGDKVISIVNGLQSKFDLLIASKDWHPLNHISFAQRHKKNPGEVIEINGLKQELWPNHCVQHTPGAEFSPRLKSGGFDKIFHKGTDPEIDGYSAFFDNAHNRSTGLEEYLKKKGIKELYIAGLATDFCVKYTVLDGLKLGLKMHVIVDACAGINLRAGDVDLALKEMKEAGASFHYSKDIKS